MIYRVHLHKKTAPGSTYYDGYVDVFAEDEEEAIDQALKKLKRTTFKDVDRSSWVIDQVEERP